MYSIFSFIARPFSILRSGERYSILSLAATAVLLAGLAAADDYPRSPGLDIVHYEFRLELRDDTDAIAGETTVVVRSRDDSASELRLDLVSASEGKGMTVTAVEEDGGAASFTHEANVLRIRRRAPVAPGEERRYRIRYEGTPADGLVIAPNRHGERTFSADNWPNKTRHWLPTLDHPYDKATCEFVITAPSHYDVIANGLLVEESQLGDGTRRTHWRQSVPISTWLMVVSAGRYAVQYVDTYRDVSIQSWVYASDRDAGFFDFARARGPLEFFDTHVGEYAYEKLANVQVTAPVGATEAATAVFYQQDFVTGRRVREWVIAHEIAHHWFGNAVTESDWDDVWLSEGFATYFTLLFIEHSEGRDRFLERLLESRDTVLEFDANDPEYTIVHDDLSDMSRVTSSHTYQKGAWVLHMLRGILGEDAFWGGIRDYYREFKNDNATTADFRRVMERHHGAELGWFFEQWLYRGGVPTVEGSWSWDAGAVRVELTQPADAASFRLPLEIEIRDADGARVEAVTHDGGARSFTFAQAERPDDVILDPRRFVLMRDRFGRK